MASQMAQKFGGKLRQVAAFCGFSRVFPRIWKYFFVVRGMGLAATWHALLGLPCNP
jgi:hypothetical protein